MGLKRFKRRRYEVLCKEELVTIKVLDGSITDKSINVALNAQKDLFPEYLSSET